MACCLSRAQGELTQVLRGLSSIAPEERRTVGAAANKVKDVLEERLAGAEESVKTAQLKALAEQGRIDVTLPGRTLPVGRLHPTTQMVREICDAFVSMGFQIVEGPEVEWDRYNFEMLNIPKDHPARDMWDTLWIDYQDESGERPMLLRTHTSPMQIRTMESNQPPIRVVVPGKCYRYEATDATHEWHFYQIEGLAVDEGITFADMKGTLYEFARLVFGSERKVRFRVDYFPFVEPGAEMSIDCFVCKGRGCKRLQGHGLDRDPGRRDGEPQGPGGRGIRLLQVHRLCLWHGAGTHCHAQVRNRRYTPLLQQRPALPAAVLKGDRHGYHIRGGRGDWADWKARVRCAFWWTVGPPIPCFLSLCGGPLS